MPWRPGLKSASLPHFLFEVLVMIFYMYMGILMHVCLCAKYVPDAYRDQKMTLDPRELGVRDSGPPPHVGAGSQTKARTF